MQWSADAARRLGGAAALLLGLAVAEPLGAQNAVGGEEPSGLVARSDPAARSDAGVVWPSAVTGRVRLGIADRWAVDPERIRLEWGAVRDGWRPAEDAVPELIGAGIGGSWIVAFAAETPGATAVRVRLRAGTEVREPVAARDMERETVLSADDIMWRASVQWGAPDPAAAAVEPGWVTRRRVARGEPLREPAVERPAAVRAGEVVRVVWRRAGIAIAVEGTAIGSAALGERVIVRTETGRRLEGIAAGPSLVRIGGPSEGNS